MPAALLAGERVFYAHGPTTRNLTNLARNIPLAWRLLGRLRPKVIVTTGAGIAVPFAWLARIRGAKVVYVESLTRIDGPSLSYRLIRPFTSRVYVQWPEMASIVRGARYAGNLLQAVMILVTTGTNAPAFDRLLRAVEHIDNGESLVVQHGPSKLRPPGARCVDYLAFDQFVELVREARVVITHAGVGLDPDHVDERKAANRRPPRSRALESMSTITSWSSPRRLSEIGVVTLVEDPDELAGALHAEETVHPDTSGDQARRARPRPCRVPPYNCQRTMTYRGRQSGVRGIRTGSRSLGHQ